MAARGLDLVITSGGLGPTADDLTAEVVGRFQGREMRLDPAVEERIAEILRPLAKRFPERRHGGRAGGQPQTGDGARGRHRAGPGRHRPRPGGAPAGRPRAPDGGGAPRPAAGAAADVGHGRRERGDESRAEGRRPGRAADAAAVRDPRVGDRRDPAGGRTGGGRARAPGGHHLPETGRGGGRERLRPGRGGGLRAASTRSWPAATPTPSSPPTGSSVDQQVAALLRGGGPRRRPRRWPRPSPAPAGCWPPA